MNPQTPQPVQPYAQPQAAPGQPMPVPYGMVAEDPGKGMGIASLVTSLLGISLVGLILGIIGRNQSAKAGYQNGMALAGIIISSIGLVLGFLTGMFFIIVAIIAASSGS